MVLFAALIAQMGEMCFFSFVALFFSLVAACHAHSLLCPIHLFHGCWNKPLSAVMIAWGLCGICVLVLNLLPSANAVSMHRGEGGRDRVK